MVEKITSALQDLLLSHYYKVSRVFIRSIYENKRRKKGIASSFKATIFATSIKMKIIDTQCFLPFRQHGIFQKNPYQTSYQDPRGASAESMKTKLFLEPKGKVREEIILESVVPDKWNLFKKWKQAWISKKSFKEWLKQDWPTSSLGELRPGKILKIAAIDESLAKPKGKLYAFRSFYLESTGEKKKMPVVLFGQVKSNYKIDDFVALLELSEEQKEELKQDLKHDPWAPISIWHSKPINRNEEIPQTELVSSSVDYTRALFAFDFKSLNGSSFTETELFTA